MIQHQTQPTFNTCMATCLAMLAGRPAAEVAEQWHSRFELEGARFSDALDSFNIMHFPCDAHHQKLLNSVIYVLTVPSLNITGGLHMILLVCEEGKRPVVYDPAKGYENRMHYVVKDAGDLQEGEFNLMSFICDHAIPFRSGAEQ